MAEAIIKYAVNSSLGTEDFEPLDVTIKEMQTELGAVSQALDYLLNGNEG